MARILVVSRYENITKLKFAHSNWQATALQFCDSATIKNIYIEHLTTGPLGNSEVCFPRISMFPEGPVIKGFVI